MYSYSEIFKSVLHITYKSSINNLFNLLLGLSEGNTHDLTSGTGKSVASC